MAGTTPQPPSLDEPPPSLRKPSQAYVDSYIARRGDARTPGAVTPASDALGGGARPGRHAPRIFYKLETSCPAHYYPKLHASSSSIRTMRVLLLVLCVVQLVIAFAILYATAVTGYLHDPFHEVFTEGVASLCAFAACAGFVGVCASSRPMLLFLYINQLWSLSNVSTFAVIYLTTDEQSATACHLFATGELSRQQLEDRGLDCAAAAAAGRLLGAGLLFLIVELWSLCFLCKIYSEMLMDAENDEADAALVDFVWKRRGETWAKLEKFEDVVQRQFEELRMSLVAHAHHAQKLTDNSTPQPASPR
jgi:hypothetical protein